MSELRVPVECIHEWYSSLDEFHQFVIGFTIAGAVGMKNFQRDNFAPFVEEYFTQRHSVSGHIGRAITVRAIIDWYFWKERRRDILAERLDDVETGHPVIRRLANEAISKHEETQRAADSAFDTWQAIRQGELSDDQLEYTESQLVAMQIRNSSEL